MTDGILDPTPSRRAISRRTIAKGVTWAAPALVVATAAPALATSLRKDPGINGWVAAGVQRAFLSCDFTLSIDSTVSRPRTPDGAPYGLYLYDVDESATVSSAKLTFWIIGNATVSWSTRSDHSSCWSGPVRGAAQQKPDGVTYTPYTWTYDCTVDAGVQAVGSDGVSRLWLRHFNVRGSFSQPWNECGDVTYWMERTVTVDRDGGGGRYEPEVLTFQRRNGYRGPFTGGRARARSSEAVVEANELAEGETFTAPV